MHVNVHIHLYYLTIKLGSYSYCSETCFFHFAIYDGHSFRKVHMGLASFLQWRGMLDY